MITLKEPTFSAPLDIEFREVEHNSADYLRAIALRADLLRKPLGLKFTQEQLEAEADEIHLIGATRRKFVIAVLVLGLIEPEVAKMRQVAVDSEWQNRGLGRQLVGFAEHVAIDRGATVMFCHARDVAIPFYEKLGYRQVGKPFEEVGIEHRRMEKVLTDLAVSDD